MLSETKHLHAPRDRSFAALRMTLGTQFGGIGMYVDALRFSLLFKSIALRTMAPITIGPVQKRLKPNVKKAIKIDIMSRGK
jgi:hypothetical protein